MKHLFNPLLGSFLLSLGLFFSACSPGSENESLLLHSENDPYLPTFPTSQFFEFPADEDAVQVGQSGSTFIFPKGCFLDEQGEIYTGSVKVELVEGHTLDDMVLANLTTQSDDEPLFTDGMLYWSPTSSTGEHLQVNPDLPVYIEIPTSDRQPDMQLYRGIRDEAGNMNWIDPEPIEQFLVTVPIEGLDFYPPGFVNEVEMGLPFRGHYVTDKPFTDSLYGALAVLDPESLSVAASRSLRDLDPREKELEQVFVEQGYELRLLEPADEMLFEESHGESDASHRSDFCGLDPVSVLTIWQPSFGNSLIATREFESRLRLLHLACSQEGLDIYLNGLDQSLWQLDEQVGQLLGDTPEGRTFQELSRDKLGKVENAAVQAQLLKEHYAKAYAASKAELESAQAKASQEFQTQKKLTQATVNAYQKVLNKRQSERLEKYGFTTTRTGWLNVDKPGIPNKDWFLPTEEERFAVVVPHDKIYDRTNVYAITASPQSMQRLEQDENGSYLSLRNTPLPKTGLLQVVVVAMKGDDLYFAQDDFPAYWRKGNGIQIEPKQKSLADIRSHLQVLDASLSGANSVEKDLEAQIELLEQERYFNQRQVEAGFLMGLIGRISTPCADPENGLALFKANCARCHSEKLCIASTGPPLAGVTKKRRKSWLYSWIKNSSAMIEAGDEEATAIWLEYNKGVMSAMPHLTNRDIDDILAWIEAFGDCDDSKDLASN